MRSIRRREPPEHLVITDTNVLWCEDKAAVVSPDFEQFWGDFASEFTLTLVVPDVVRGELLFQQTTSALKALGRATAELSRVAVIAGQQYSLRLTEERVRADVESRLDRWLQQRRARVEPTPVSSIDWQRLILDAIWRRAPFEQDPKNPEFEKGFRDALVLETVRAVSAQTALGRRVAFITADAVLRNATAKAVSANLRTTCYESLSELASYLRLTKEKLDEQFVREIQTRATRRFFNRSDSNCLYWQAKKLVRERFASELGRPSLQDDLMVDAVAGLGNDVRWEPITSESIRIAAAQFDRLEGGHNFFWKSPVIFAQAFRCVWAPTETLRGVDYPERLRVLTFDISWKARVKRDGRFHDLELCDVNLRQKTFQSFEHRELSRYGLTPIRVAVAQSGGEAA